MNIFKPPDIQKAIDEKNSKQIIKAFRWFPKLHTQAIEALGVIADIDCIVQLETIVNYSSSVEDNRTAIKALSRIDGPETGNILVRFAYNSLKDDESRILALNSIRPEHKPTELDTLIKCASEYNPDLRTAAIKALLRIDSEQAEEEFFNLLHNYNKMNNLARERLTELLVECSSEWFGQQSVLRPSIIKRLIKEYAVKACRESKKWGAFKVLAGAAHLAALEPLYEVLADEWQLKVLAGGKIFHDEDHEIIDRKRELIPILAQVLKANIQQVTDFDLKKLADFQLLVPVIEARDITFTHDPGYGIDNTFTVTNTIYTLIGTSLEPLPEINELAKLEIDRRTKPGSA